MAADPSPREAILARCPHLLAPSRDGSALWAACAPENVIVEADTSHEAIRRLWDTKQKGSYLLAPTPDGKKLYVANFDAGSISIIHRPMPPFGLSHFVAADWDRCLAGCWRGLGEQ